MKIIKPQELPFTSNISEPDASQGEAVYSEAEDTVYPFANAGDIDSVSYDSVNSRYSTMLSDNSLRRVRSSYTSSNSILSSSPIPQGAAVETASAPMQFRESAFLNGIILATTTLDSERIYRSADGGETWLAVDVGIDGGDTPKSVVAAFGAFYCSAYAKIYKSSDGLSWSAESISSLGGATNATPLVFDGTYLSLITSTHVKRYSGTGWSSLSNELPASESFVTGIISGDAGSIYAAAFSGKIYLSQDGGLDWFHASNYSGQISSISNDGLDFYFTSFQSSTLNARHYVSFGNYTSQEIDLTISPSDTVWTISLSGEDIIMATFLGRVVIRDLSENKTYVIENNGESLNDICIADNYINIFSPTKVYTVGIGSIKMASEYNKNDNSMGGGLTINNYVRNGKQYVQVVHYNTLFTSVTSATEYELSASEFASARYGQCCYDGRYIFQLIYDGGSWFVYRVDTLSSAVNSVDLGATNTGYINQFNSENPALFLVGDNLNVPINKSLSSGKFDAVLRLDKTPATTVDVVPNKVLTSNAVAAIYTSGETVTWFCENDTVEITGNIDFNSLSGYREGDEVISLSTHRKYRAATATLDTPEFGVNQVPPTWTDIAPTNKYAFSDIYIHNKTIAQSSSGKITFTMNTTTATDSISFFGLSSVSEVDVYFFNSNGDQISVTNKSLIDYEATLKTGEETLLDSLVIIGDDYNDQAVSFRVELISDSSGSPAAVGRMVVGKAVEMGVTQYGAKLSIEDFSRRERDEFGNFTIIPRDTAKNIDFDVKIPKEDVNFVFTYLSKLTTIPCVFLGDDDDAAVQVYGYYSDYTHNIDYPSITSATISVEGLT